MTALLEQPADADATGGFEIVRVTADHPDVRRLLERHFEKMGIALGTSPLGIHWFALVKSETVYAVVGLAPRADGGVEVTDFYCDPSREGLRAGYVALEFLKTLVDSGRMRYVVGVILHQNVFGQRHFEKVFGREPASHIYVYDGAKR